MFRFTIRDLIWLTVVVALAVAWWADRSRLARRISQFHEFLVFLEKDHNAFGRQSPMLRHPDPKAPSD